MLTQEYTGDPNYQLSIINCAKGALLLINNRHAVGGEAFGGDGEGAAVAVVVEGDGGVTVGVSGDFGVPISVRADLQSDRLE